MEKENKYLTVTALNKYIAYKFDSDQALRSVLIKAEISNCRISGGHLYFSLKDENSEIRSIMFKSAVIKNFLFGLISYFVVTRILSFFGRNTQGMRSISFVMIILIAYFIIPLYKKKRA